MRENRTAYGGMAVEWHGRDESFKSHFELNGNAFYSSFLLLRGGYFS